MTFISYAQNYEDVMLWRALKHVQKGFYIDVGAAWPEEHSVTKCFYDKGWHGINIEPNPGLFAQLHKQRLKDINLAIAISDQPGSLMMNFINDTGLSTLDESIIATHKAVGWQPEKKVVEITTLAIIWKKHIALNQQVHFLKVDVEGLEKEVLQGNDWNKYRPWVVIVEATIPMSKEESYTQWEGLLLSADYRFVYADGLNRFYVANEHAELISAFKYPPNVFDEFMLYSQQKMNAHALHSDELRQKADKLRQQSDELRHKADVQAQQSDKLRQKAETQAQQSDELRQKAEVQFQQLDELRQKLEVQVQHAEAQISSFINSISWRITSPLRNRLFRVLLHKFGRNRSRVVNTEESLVDDFIPINFDKFEVLFSKDPLIDSRGIGRVTRELLGQLQSLSKQQKRSTTKDLRKNQKAVYFYSSIHWCPDILPQPSVIMIHDVIPLIFPEQFPEASKDWSSRFKAIAQQAQVIITISESSAKDISRLLEIPKDRIQVVYNGISKLPIANEIQANLPASPYVVFLGSYDKHKNIEVVLRALKLADMKQISLVMIGDNKKCLKDIKELHIEDRVYFLGRLEDAHVGYVLQNALALVFPSLYEGFGLPPFEAALLGTPSICSRRPAMDELLEDAALFADPYIAEEWAMCIQQLIDDPCLCDKLNIKAYAENFTWERSANQLLRILAEV